MWGSDAVPYSFLLLQIPTLNFAKNPLHLWAGEAAPQSGTGFSSAAHRARAPASLPPGGRAQGAPAPAGKLVQSSPG